MVERHWLFAIDESGSPATTHYGFGLLAMPWERRGDFVAGFEAIRRAHRWDHEVKWSRLQHRPAMARDLVDFFFETPWLAFHCMVVRKADIRQEVHGGDYDLAWRKHLTGFLANKARRLASIHSFSENVIRVWIDPIASSYAKANEAAHVIATNMLGPEISSRCRIKYVRPRDSRSTHAIQLCDLLVGSVVTSWLKEGPGAEKPALRRYVAGHLGWDDLRHGTFARQVKFNVWFFHDPTDGPRQVLGKGVSFGSPPRHAVLEPAAAPKPSSGGRAP